MGEQARIVRVVRIHCHQDIAGLERGRGPEQSCGRRAAQATVGAVADHLMGKRTMSTVHWVGRAVGAPVIDDDDKIHLTTGLDAI